MIAGSCVAPAAFVQEVPLPDPDATGFTNQVAAETVLQEKRNSNKKQVCFMGMDLRVLQNTCLLKSMQAPMRSLTTAYSENQTADCISLEAV